MFLGTICPQVEMKGENGRRKVLAANTKSVLRIVQSIPSPKAERMELPEKIGQLKHEVYHGRKTSI